MSINTASENDPSETMSAYMLRGWVLTNDPCPKPGCVVPLLRSKLDRTIRFCAKCDPAPAFTQTNGTMIAAKLEESVLESATNELAAKYSPELVNPELENEDEDSEEEWVMQEETEATKARRAQSSLASRLMGPKLLQGFTMLDIQCPNPTCYGIPLLRDRSQQTHCVICENGSPQQTSVPGSSALKSEVSKPSSLQLQQTVSSVSAVRKHAAVSGNEPENTPVVCKRRRITDTSHIPSPNAQATFDPPVSSVSKISVNGCESDISLLALTLSRKLEWLRQELEAETDLVRIQHLCLTLECCVNAVRNCGANGL